MPRGMEMTEERIYTVDDVAELLGFHRNTVLKWIASGELVASRLGRREYRIRQTDLDELMRRKQIKPKQDH